MNSSKLASYLFKAFPVLLGVGLKCIHGIEFFRNFKLIDVLLTQI